MADLDSFFELPNRDDFHDFAPARDAHIRAKPSLIRESRSSAVLQAVMDLQDQLRRQQSAFNRRCEEMTEETSRYKAQLDGDHARSTKDQASLVRQLEEAREQLERTRARKHRSDSVTNASHTYQSPPASPGTEVYLDDGDGDMYGERYGDDDSGACDSDEQSSSSPPPPWQRSTSSRRSRRPAPLHHVDGQHYHLDLAHLPFVVGQSTAPSHSLAGSLQTVLAELKRHHPVICDHVGPPRAHGPRHCRAAGATDCCSRSTISSRAKQTQRGGAPDRSGGAGSSGGGRLDRRQVLRDMRTLRTILHRDDVCWT